MKPFSLIVLFLGIFSANIHAQLLSPNEFLAHKVGEQFTPHHQLVAYYQHVAANAKQVKLIEFGKSTQGRPMLMAIISSAENMARLEQIRLNNLYRTGLVQGKANSNDQTAIVWLSHSVHGNEAAGSESAMRTLYYMASGKNADANEWLKNTVVILDPAQNPDGYDRYTHWYRDAGNLIPNSNADAREHIEPWPGGRVNHYMFDLNRDWAWLSQVESRHRIKAYQEWMPHVHADIHEMGYEEPYYFAPAAQPYHRLITPFQSDFQQMIGKNNAKHFDENNWLYFSREVFDLFYPSYGDTYPTYNGSIGMTYEQGGIRAGRAIQTTSDVLTLEDRVQHHHIAALSTIEISSKNAAALVKNFTEYFDKANNNPVGDYKTFVIKSTNNRSNMKKLCELLDAHQIKYGTNRGVSGIKGYDYMNRKETILNVAENDLIISANQPKSILAQILFEPESVINDSLTYDITAWSLPYAYGLESYATKEKLAVKQGYTFPTAIMDVKNEKPYAYLVAWKSLSNAQFLSALMQKDIRVRIPDEPFEVEGKSYDAGTLIILRTDNKRIPDFDENVKQLAKTLDQDLVGVQTGFVSKGKDFGSSHVKILKKRNVAIVYGERISNTAYGSIWYFFEQDLKYPITPIAVDRLSRTDLSQFDVLILADGTYNINADGQDKIRKWISAGGQLILTEESISTFSEAKGFGLVANEGAKDSADVLAPYAGAERRNISELIPGAIFQVNMDTTHPLAFGLKNPYYSLKTNTLSYAWLKEGINVGYLKDKPLAIGFAGAKAKAKMKNSSVFAIQPMGGGNVIYMVDNPLFRAFWHNGKLLFANAVFLVGN